MQNTYLVWDFIIDGPDTKVRVIAENEADARCKASQILSGATLKLIEVVEYFNKQQEEAEFRDKWAEIMNKLMTTLENQNKGDLK